MPDMTNLYAKRMMILRELGEAQKQLRAVEAEIKVELIAKNELSLLTVDWDALFNMYYDEE